MTTEHKGDFKSMMHQLESTLDLYLVQKAPALPTGVKEFIVKIGPWITLVLLIMALPALLAIFGIGAFLAPFSFLGGAYAGINYIISMLILAVTLVLEALAIPQLFHREKGGWTKMYYASLLGIISNLVTFNIGSAIIGGGIGLYILFQIKSYYK